MHREHRENPLFLCVSMFFLCVLCVKAVHIKFTKTKLISMGPTPIVLTTSSTGISLKGGHGYRTAKQSTAASGA